MVTLKDIAQACDVSVSTVSRALNGIQLIRPERAESIRQTAREMGYTPDAAAQTLKTNRSRMIGVLYEVPMTHPYFSKVMDDIRMNAEERGYDILLLSRSSQNDYTENALRRRMDGVILVFANVDASGVNRLISSDIPVISVDDCSRPCDAVISDYQEGTRQLIELAARNGHQRIAFIHGQMGYATGERLLAYRRAVKELGLCDNPGYIRQAAFNNGAFCARETEALLGLPKPPTCILMPDDYSAINALQLLQKKGIQAPRDFSCAGYDGISWSQQISPKLTTYRQNTEEIGRTAFNILQSALSEGKKHIMANVLVHGALLSGETMGRIPPAC